MYVKLYSDYSTWGGYSPPLDGQNLTIGPHANLLIDTTTAQLNQLTVLDSRIVVAETADLLIRAQAISITNGALMIGTQSQPYTHRL